MHYRLLYYWNMTQRDTVALKKAVVVLALCLYISAFSVVMPVSGAFSSVVITDVEPTEFHPGETKDVVLTVKNNGARDARDVRLIFAGSEWLSLVGPTVFQINTLNSWCSKEIKITVHAKEGTPNGVYSIDVGGNWYECYFDPVKGHVANPKPAEGAYTPMDISFNVKGDVIINVGNVRTEPAHVRPGDEDVRIHAQIWNSGEASAKDVDARLICNGQFEPSWSGTDRYYIGKLDSGKSVESLFHVDVADNVKAGMYSLPLYILYKDTANIPDGIKTSIDVLVERKPELEIVSSYTEPTNISPGDHVILHVRVQNVGSEEAESVSVRVTGEADVPFDFAVKSDHVGNLKVNETGDAILEFDVDKDAAKKIYPLGLEIRCVGDRDLGDDKVYTFDKQIQVEVTSSSSSIPGFECLFVLIALILAFIMRRKRV
ncbi:hypothetical protein C5S29_03415 [ANME-1 cluster archaeon GoMg3.2]|nr:hypothetical protein [ANME-1 cluster archaeon GoMg3.2]